MKKFVKPLVIAASVAAVAGIGAVSFAAWSAGDAKTATSTGSTGSTVTTIGDIKVAYNGGTPDAALNIDKKLVPYDQSNSDAVLDDASNAVEIWKLTLSNSATSDTNVEYYIGLTSAFDGGTSGKLYFSTSYDGTSAITSTSGWTELNKVVSATEDGHKLSAKGDVYIILEATGSDAQGKDVKLTFTAKQGTATT